MDQSFKFIIDMDFLVLGGAGGITYIACIYQTDLHKNIIGFLYQKITWQPVQGHLQSRKKTNRLNRARFASKKSLS